MGVSYVGIDPGLVHTGMVALNIDDTARKLSVRYRAFDTLYDAAGALDAARSVRAVRDHLSNVPVSFPLGGIFVEAYRSRGNNLRTDAKMRALLSEFRLHMPSAEVIDNTGSKQVVRPALLRLLDMEAFPATHHQDLQAAARILVFGMLKQDTANRYLYDIVDAHLDLNPWLRRKAAW
jgi:hypothetical protein